MLLSFPTTAAVVRKLTAAAAHLLRSSGAMTQGPELDRQLTPQIRARRWAHRSLAAHTFRASAHAGMEIAWPEEGVLQYRIGARTLTVPPGSLVIVPAQVEHRTAVSGGTRAGSLWLSPQLFEGAAEALGRRSLQLQAQVLPAAAVAALGRMILEEAAAFDPGAPLAAEALAQALSWRLLRAPELHHDSSARAAPGHEDRGGSRGAPPSSTRTGAAPRGDPRIARAVERVQREYQQPLGLDALAATARMSRFHFARLFRAEVGLSPYQFLLKTRVERAAELLRSGRASVTEAALEVGFTDLSRFARAFRRAHGCAPQALRPGAGSARFAC